MGIAQNIRAGLRRSVVGDLVRKARRAHIPRADFTPLPELAGGRPLLYVVGSSFDQDKPHSTTMISNGFARGWAKAVGPARLVEARQLMRSVGNFEKPVVFLSIYHLSDLSYDDCRRLRNFDVFIWISIHPRKVKEFEAKVLEASLDEDTNVWLQNYGKVLLVQPKFVCNSAARSGMEWYQGWIDDGLRFEALQLAADDSLYFPERSENKFGAVQMAYVGGYWPEKAQAFEQYLRPFEDIIWTYGYSKWPYRHYGGLLNETEERQLYSTAKILPLVGCPSNWVLTDITERYFKAPACRGFCIADEHPGLRELFSEDEMLQAASAAHFKELAEAALAGKIDTEAWARKGYEAVLRKHLYSHRALQIVKALERSL